MANTCDAIISKLNTMATSINSINTKVNLLATKINALSSGSGEIDISGLLQNQDSLALNQKKIFEYLQQNNIALLNINENLINNTNISKVNQTILKEDINKNLLNDDLRTMISNIELVSKKINSVFLGG